MVMDIDVEQVIGVTERDVAMGQRDGEDVRIIRLTRRYETEIDDLWSALTDPERLPRWFLPVTGDLRPGGRFQIEGHASGEVVSCEAPTSFELTWEGGPNLSWLEVRLEPDGDGTVLRLVHTVPVDAHWDDFGPGAVGIGWDLLLTLGLSRHLISGHAVDPSEVAQWSAGEQGRAFVRLCGREWCRVQIAAGAPPAKAEGMAERTIAAYTGVAPG